MPVITSAVLGAINNGLNLAYNTQLYAAVDPTKPFTFDANSTGASEVYPSLGMLKGVREWIGAREVQSLSQTQFSIANKTFEETIAIKREDIEDDKYGMYSVVAGQMGQDAGQLPPLLKARLLLSGQTGIGPDGKPYFGNHSTFDANGRATTVSNLAVVTGNGAVQGAPWYLFDTSKILKPLIYQRRRDFQLTTRFNLADPSVFDNNEFTWGIDGRCNAGYGLWQLAFMSTQPLNVTNLIAARTAMAAIRRPNGTPMGIVPDTIVCGSTLFPLAQSLYRDQLIGSDPTTPTTLVANQVIGMFKPIELLWLN